MIQEQTSATSCYVPYLYLGKESHRIVNEQFIAPRVKKFFDARNIKVYEPIDVTKYISDLDFSDSKAIPFDYFYDYILTDISKTASGEIYHVVKYAATLDEQVTSKTCEKTKIKHDEILLNTKPIFYFIYFDLREILSFLRTYGQKDRLT